jgi:flagellar protein FlgJ
MTTPVDSAAQTYADFAGLDALKRSAANRDPAALRAVARQFEALFTRMMIKSMRDAAGTDPIFGSDQQKMYEGMYDDQLSLELTHGKGLGLADMLVRQLQRLATPGSTPASPSSKAAAASPTAAASAPQTSAASPAEQKSFVKALWPAAQSAAQELGTDPRNLVAQAALETGWGRNVPRAASGGSSNNLFGMKASETWSGATIDAPTVEYRNGTAVATTGSFRSYASAEQSVKDYVALLRQNPRYTAALNTGSDAQAFGTALQRGGYATDPAYAAKLSAIAARLSGPQQDSLKLASTLPITPGTGTL